MMEVLSKSVAIATRVVRMRNKLAQQRGSMTTTYFALLAARVTDLMRLSPPANKI